MEKISTILLALFIIPLVSFGQKSYAPLNATWNYEGWEIDCKGNHIQYIVENEIMVQGKDCSVISVYHASNTNPTFVKLNESLVVWEDASKVYFLEDTSFYLLFDFTASMGDTITYYDPVNKNRFSSTTNYNPSQGPNELQLLVNDVSVHTINNQQRKHFTTEAIFLNDSICSSQQLIIENIGSSSMGLTGEHCLYVAAGCFGGLQCYKNDTFQYLSNSQFSTPNPKCDELIATEDLFKEGAINIFPNPTSNVVNIETNLDLDYVELVNLSGQVLHVFENENKIQLEDFAAGIYFLRIIADDSRRTFKVIKR